MRAADATYPLLTALLDRAHRRSGSKMNAYSDVARAIGETGSWVRKFMGRQRVRLDADTYLNIKAEYERECARWEAEAELQKARFFALGRGDHAMAQAPSGAMPAAEAADDQSPSRGFVEACCRSAGERKANSILASLGAAAQK